MGTNYYLSSWKFILKKKKKCSRKLLFKTYDEYLWKPEVYVILANNKSQ